MITAVQSLVAHPALTLSSQATVFSQKFIAALPFLFIFLIIAAKRRKIKSREK
jgi:hypothetical protein